MEENNRKIEEAQKKLVSRHREIKIEEDVPLKHI